MCEIFIPLSLKKLKIDFIDHISKQVLESSEYNTNISENSRKYNLIQGNTGEHEARGPTFSYSIPIQLIEDSN